MLMSQGEWETRLVGHDWGRPVSREQHHMKTCTFCHVFLGCKVLSGQKMETNRLRAGNKALQPFHNSKAVYFGMDIKIFCSLVSGSFRTVKRLSPAVILIFHCIMLGYFLVLFAKDLLGAQPDRSRCTILRITSQGCC